MNILIKHLALGIGLMTLGAAAAGARQTSAPPAIAAGATNAAGTNVIGPKIQFETPMHDFGRARAGEPVKYTYVFTNTGDQLLVLNAVQPQCGCTTTGEWTKQVEPGKTGSIPIQFNTANYNGPVFKQVTVSCNVKSQPTMFLQLKGTVYKPYELNPPMLILNVPPDAETASGIVTITNHTEEPFMLWLPESNNRAFAAELKTNAPGQGYQLIISVVPPLPPGSVQGQISLRTSWTNPSVISVTAAANVQPAVTVTPPRITLAPGPLPNAVTNSVSLQNNSTNLLQLSEPTVNAPGVDAQIHETQPGRLFAAVLTFPQGFQLPPGQQVELSIKSSNPKFPVVKVPVVQMPRPVQPPVRPTPTMKPVPSRVGAPPLPPPVPGGQ